MTNNITVLTHLSDPGLCQSASGEGGQLKLCLRSAAHTHAVNTLKCIVGSRQQLCVTQPPASKAVFRAHGRPFFQRAPSSCAVIRADSLWRAFELTSKEKKEILWVPVFSCPPHLSHTHTSHILTLQLPSHSGTDCNTCATAHPQNESSCEIRPYPALFNQKTRLNNQCEHGFRQSLRGNREEAFYQLTCTRLRSKARN